MKQDLKVPICMFCLKSGILCPACEEKVKSGEVTDLDIKLAKSVIKLEGNNPSIQKITYKKAYESGDTVIVIVGKGDMLHISGSGGKILRAISQEVGKKVKVLESGGNDRQFLENLLAPLNIVTINTIWLPDGSTESRVIIAGSSRRLPIEIESLKKLARDIRGIILRVEFENTLGTKLSWT